MSGRIVDIKRIENRPSVPSLPSTDAVSGTELSAENEGKVRPMSVSDSGDGREQLTSGNDGGEVETGGNYGAVPRTMIAPGN